MSKFKLIKKLKPVMEDVIQPQQGQVDTNNQQTNTQQNIQKTPDQINLDNLREKIKQMEIKHAADETKYNQELGKLKEQEALLTKKVQQNESLSTQQTQKTVNESVAYGKQAELSGLIQDAFANVEDKLSYWPSTKEIEDGFFDHIARGVIRYINKNGFGMADEADHTTDIANALLSYFKNTKVNYSDREIEHIYLALLDIIEKTDNSFKWLIKRKKQNNNKNVKI